MAWGCIWDSDRVSRGKFDGLVKSQEMSFFVIRTKLKRFHPAGCKPAAWVIPAKAGIQVFSEFLDSGFRRGDGEHIMIFLNHLRSV